MNILQIVPNKGWGGGEKYVWELSRSLSEAGHAVSVVIPPCDILAKKFAGMDTATLRFRGPYDLGAIRRLARLVRKNGIDVIHTHIFKHASAALLARKLYGLNVRVVMTRHLCRPAKTGLHYPWLYSHVDRLVFVSEQAKKVFLSSAPKIPADRITVIPNSVRLPDDTAGGTNVRESVGPDRFVIGFAGTIMPAKGVEFILDLAENLRDTSPEIVFAIAGNPPEGKEDYLVFLKNEALRRGLQNCVKFVGFVENTIAFFRQTDAVIVPTLVPESFGMVVVEAMLARKPVLFTDNIPAEVITPEEGIRIDPQDIPECCRSIVGLQHDPALRESLAERGYRRWQERFSYDLFLTRMLDVYRNR
ncbi:glycosyltransferase family 4 protein [Rikenella microfusus]|uniref:Glycogen synthase n=1 Tax=Rikenella microfusus TaxID=28139 RepID=A0A379MUE1_9BACT|nr:glycosyltransferase family 4 protein [Rikenella microfusus]SUE34379.1 Glycogen synthase [Rikenella microfusus]